MPPELDRQAAEQRFQDVFRHLGAIAAYARRRGSPDPDAVAAEVMAIAWRRLADVPSDDPRPWLYATARNLVFVEARRSRRTAGVEPERVAPAPEARGLDPALWSALRSLPPLDREALLLVAWEDLGATQAAQALGINPTAFRVRLLRARRRLRTALEQAAVEDVRPTPVAQLDVEGT